MTTTSPVTIRSKAGIKRDGTRFEGQHYVDGQWVRFNRGLPRKMGGYRRLTDSLSGPPRELEVLNHGMLSWVHSGSAEKLEEFTIDPNGNVSVISDRTPAGFAADDNNDWQFANVYSTSDTAMKLLAHAAPSLMDIASDAEFPVYIGDTFDTAALTAVAASDISGGVMALQTYAVAYGSNGRVNWYISNDPSAATGAGSGDVNVTDQKIIMGLPLRGGGNSPAGLLWSLDSLLRMYFVGGGPIFAFDTISSQSSIMSANSVIEYDGIYYWMGVDRFLMFNGVLQELDNDLSMDFLFDNFNYAVRGKAFSFKIPRFGEIWWCVPLFGSTEPNWAIIYNVRESRRLGYHVWYDTPLPDDLRGASHYSQVMRYPLLTSAVEAAGGGYALWWHEYGKDRVEGTSVLAVRSFFETASMSFLNSAEKPESRDVRVEVVEPDFIQTGEMQAQVTGQANSKAKVIDSEPKTIPEVAATPEEQVVYFKTARRELRFRFESNTAGGFYQMGEPIAHIGPGDGRMLGAVDE